MLRNLLASLGLAAVMAATASAQILPNHAHSGPYPPGHRIPFHHGPFYHGPVRPGYPAPITGQIIGNRKTHVFHLPGDRGALPAPQNRVYFRTVSQAMAAGYHRAGQSGRPHPGPMMGRPRPMSR